MAKEYNQINDNTLNECSGKGAGKLILKGGKEIDFVSYFSKPLGQFTTQEDETKLIKSEDIEKIIFTEE